MVHPQEAASIEADVDVFKVEIVSQHGEAVWRQNCKSIRHDVVSSSLDPTLKLVDLVVRSRSEVELLSHPLSVVINFERK